MCGIVGMYATTQTGFMSPDLDQFEELLYLDAVRGYDSTGVFTVHTKNKVRLAKQATPAQIFLWSREWESLRKGAIQDGRILVGHNRKATLGDITNENAHPFRQDHIVLVHNGTIHDTKDLTDKKVDVDSHAICHAFAEKNEKAVLEELGGAWALVWYNIRTHALNLIRNTQRPLFLGKGSSGFSWMSEGAMLHVSMARNSNKAKWSDEIIELKPYTLYTIVNGRLSMEEISPKPSSQFASSQTQSWQSGTQATNKNVVYPSRGDYHPKKPLAGLLSGPNAKPSTNSGASSNTSTTDDDEYDFDMLHINQKVVFMPTTLHKPIPGGAKQFKITGLAYVPGIPPIPALWFAPETVSEKYAEELARATKLTAEVRTYYGKDSSTVVLKNVENPINNKDIEGELFTDVEVRELEETFFCIQCHKQLKGLGNKVNFSRILQSIQDPEEYEVTCADCVEKETNASNDEVINRTVPQGQQERKETFH